MANPRKFSEKIALHTHRQAEETARFEQIMKEVSDATARVAPAKNTLRINNQTLGTFRGGSLPNVSAGTPTIKSASHIKDVAKPDDSVRTNAVYRESRPRSQGGPIRRPHDRKLDTSPYSSGSFLSPPPDTSWRRTNSDSALHQSTMQGLGVDRNDNSSNRWMLPPNGPENLDGRPRSSCEIPRVPGINIYPSTHEPGTVQIPIGNNTGSLPDLTSVHFPSPIHTPLDQEQEHGSSPYSSSPVNTSPSTLSPTSVPQGQRSPGRFQFDNSMQHHQSNHLSVPNNCRYLQRNKGITIDKNLSGVVDTTDFSQFDGLSGIYQQQQPQQSQCQPPSPSSSSGVYRTSSRPSPQSSPSLGGRHSAPCSPGAPSPLQNDYMFNQAHAQFQQHFEQLSMLDTPNTVSYIDQPSGMSMTQVHSQTLPEVSGVGNIDVTTDAGYYSTSPSQMMYPTGPPNMHTSPNTPTSIPDIILTDFSSADDMRLDYSFSKQLEAELLADGPLDMAELQMMSDSAVSIPDGVEDHFRLDHRS